MTIKIMVNKLTYYLPIQGARSEVLPCVYKNLIKWAIPEKNPKRGRGEELRT